MVFHLGILNIVDLCVCVCVHAYFLFILVSSFSISCEHPKKKLTLINNILEEEKPKLSKCYKKLLQN